MAKRPNGSLKLHIKLEVCAADRAAIGHYYGLSELASPSAVRVRLVVRLAVRILGRQPVPPKRVSIGTRIRPTTKRGVE